MITITIIYKFWVYCHIYVLLLIALIWWLNVYKVSINNPDLRDLSFLGHPLVRLWSSHQSTLRRNQDVTKHTSHWSILRWGEDITRQMSHWSTLRWDSYIALVNAPFVHWKVGPMHYHGLLLEGEYTIYHFEMQPMCHLVNIPLVHYEVGPTQSFILSHNS